MACRGRPAEQVCASAPRSQRILRAVPALWLHTVKQGACRPGLEQFLEV
jgi:hypothetical protein